MVFVGHQWLSLVISGNRWLSALSLVIVGYQWLTLVISGYRWLSLVTLVSISWFKLPRLIMVYYVILISKSFVELTRYLLNQSGIHCVIECKTFTRRIGIVSGSSR